MGTQVEALAQIKAAMAAPNSPVACIILRANGTSEEIVEDHRKLGAVLGGQPTVIGGIVSLGVMGVALKDSKGKRNKHALPATWDTVKGDIVLFRVSDDGAPAPFQLAEFKKWVKEGMNDVAPEPEEELESESGEESDASDEDEESFEVFSARMKALPVSELKRACGILGLSDKGSKPDMIARMHAHSQANASLEDDSEEEEDSAAPTPVKVTKAKAKKAPAKSKGKAPPKSRPGPVKAIAKKPLDRRQAVVARGKAGVKGRK